MFFVAKPVQLTDTCEARRLELYLATYLVACSWKSRQSKFYNSQFIKSWRNQMWSSVSVVNYQDVVFAPSNTFSASLVSPPYVSTFSCTTPPQKILSTNLRNRSKNTKTGFRPVQFRLEKADFFFFIVTLYTFEVNLPVSCEIDFYSHYLVFYNVLLTCVYALHNKHRVRGDNVGGSHCQQRSRVILVRSMSVIQYWRVHQWTGRNRSAAARSFITLQWVQV